MTFDQNGSGTEIYKDDLGRTVLTLYDDGSYTETLYSIGDQFVTEDLEQQHAIAIPSEPTSLNGQLLDTQSWTTIPSGDYEEVTIGQRMPNDTAPLVLTYYLYNADNELLAVWQPAVVDNNPNSSTHGESVEPLTLYTYDAAGNNTSQTDANGNTTTFGYDQNGNMVRETLPEPKSGDQPNTETWTYNALNEVTSHVDFNGQTTVYTYSNTPTGQGKPLTEYFFNTGVSVFDGNGNVITANAAQATTIHYNTLGQQSEVDDYVNGSLSRQTTYTYDALTQQLTSVTSPEGTITYTYDAATGLLASTSTDDTGTSYGYDDQGRLTTVTVTELNGQTLTTPLVTTYGYDAAGNKTSETLPDGEVTTYTYDDLNRLTDIVEKQGSTTLLSEHYTLNDDGTRASSTESQLQADGTTETITTAWTYDAQQRLTSETSTSSITADSYSDVYTYDQVGNRMTDTHTGPGGGGSETTTYVYNSDNELTSQTSSLSGTTTFAYDDNGSLASETNGSNVTTYTYDVRGKLATVSVNGSLIASYTYNEQGDRVSETTSAGTTYYLTDTNNPTLYSQPLEAKSALNGVPVMTYLIGDHVYGQVSASGAISYILSDGHGSTRALTNSSGTISNTFNYNAFGSAINFNPSTTPTIFLFGGDAVYDPATGLYIHGDGIRARLGFFFIQRDNYQGNTKDPLSLHKYLYVEANPTLGRDPSGHDLVDGLTLAAGLVSSTIGDALGINGLDVSIAFWGGAGEGAWAGLVAVGNNFTFHQITSLNNYNNNYWQQIGLAGTSTQAWSNGFAWAAVAAIDASIV